jgi:intein/homing endonuclease
MILTEFAELLGMHAGDGTIYRSKNSLVYELRGGKDEKLFYDNHVVNLFNKISNGFFVAKERKGGKNGCYGIRTCNKEVIQLFLDAGFPIGKKSNNVSIPLCILKGTIRIKAAFLRGLFATDGTAYLAKINKSIIKTYPIIEFATISERLRNEVRQLLTDFGIESRIWTYNSKIKNNKSVFYLRIAGHKKCELFQYEIGLSNPKHLLRIITIFKKELGVSDS